MEIGFKTVIAILLIAVFFILFVAFIAGTTGESGSFLENLWKGIESLVP